MSNPVILLRGAPSGPDLDPSTPGYVLTVQADGRSVRAEPAGGGGGTTVFLASAEINFDHVTGRRAFTVTVADLPSGAQIWASLAGPTSQAPDLIGLEGAYHSDLDEVTVVASYQGAQSSISVPINIYWIVQ